MKIVLRILIVIVLLFLLIGVLTPKHHSVSREIVIAAPSDIIHAQVNDLKKWDTWSPWEESDATITKTFGSVTEGTGANYTWKSKHSGNGKLTITKSTPDTIWTKVDFEGMGSSNSAYAFAKEDNNTKVTWSFSYDTPFPWNALSWIMGYDKSMTKEFDKGLASLKKVSEQLAATAVTKYHGYSVKEVETPTALYAFKRATVMVKDISGFLGKTYGMLSKTIMAQKANMLGPAAALYWTFDEKAGKTDMAAAFQVDKSITGPEMSTIELGGKSVVIDYYGNYEKIGDAHYGIDEYLKEKNLKSKQPVLEQYITDPMTEKDTAKWLTKIIYFIE